VRHNPARSPLFAGANVRAQITNLARDSSAERREDSGDCESHERGGHGILGQLKTCFIAKEILNHF
jgi:hypothetical protein